MKDTLKKLEEINTQYRVVIKQLEQEFNATLKQVFVDNPKLERISMYVNNHEFNDGDATSFYIGWEDMTITVDGNDIERQCGSKKTDPLLDSIIELFGQVQDIHENLYGDEYESLTIEREEILKN